jgi:hypothetical protein
MAFTFLYVVGFFRFLILFLFVFWVALIVIISQAGKKRKIGFWPSLLLSIFLTPIVGFIAVVLSDKLENI